MEIFKTSRPRNSTSFCPVSAPPSVKTTSSRGDRPKLSNKIPWVSPKKEKILSAIFFLASHYKTQLTTPNDVFLTYLPWSSAVLSICNLVFEWMYQNVDSPDYKKVNAIRKDLLIWENDQAGDILYDVGQSTFKMMSSLNMKYLGVIDHPALKGQLFFEQMAKEWLLRDALSGVHNKSIKYKI